jgi:transposase
MQMILPAAQETSGRTPRRLNFLYRACDVMTHISLLWKVQFTDSFRCRLMQWKGPTMPEARPIRDDISAKELRRRARRETNGRVASRLLALANALDGMDRGEAARRAGMDRQTLRDWVIRFNAEGIYGLRDRPKSGRPTWLDEGQMASLRALVLRGPDPERDGVSTWRAKDLCRIVEARFGVAYSENGMLRLLHDLGLSWQKTRPIHPEADLKAQARFKKNSRR